MGLTLIEAAKYENRLEHLAVLKTFRSRPSCGTRWWSGDGPPGLLPDARAGDFYLDTRSGDLYALTA